jgi:hypothetical protein
MPKIAVPLFSATGRRLPVEMPVEIIDRHVGHFTVVRNRRGHVTRAYVKRVLPIDERPASGIGIAFTQQLESGHAVWALGGVRGSDKTSRTAAQRLEPPVERCQP